MQQLVERRYRHRDLNWLSFNERVLQEAEDKTNPLYERIKFLAIFSSNLDEYFRVRVSQLRQIKRVKKSIRKKLALKPSQQTKQIIEEVKLQQQRFGQIYQKQIIPELAKRGISLVDSGNYNKEQKKYVLSFFKTQLKDFLHPVLLDITKNNNLFLENSSLHFLVNFKKENLLGLVKIPADDFGRFIYLKGKDDEHSITFLDDIVRAGLPSVFPENEITGVYEIKLSRDAQLYIDDEYGGVLAEKIYESLEQRMEGQPTRLLYDSKMPKLLQKKTRKLLNLGKIDMMPGGKYHNFKDFFTFPDPTNDHDLHYKPLSPISHKFLRKDEDYFDVISKKDRSVHFPYMPFSHIDEFMEQAATDKNVEEIKISLYRIAEESNLTTSLIKALKNGKKVTVFVEAKARFDEENNLIWGRKLEKKGAFVIYSFPKIKVHSKILIVTRREEKEITAYAYIGTGNFNSITSRIYCDHAVFTSKTSITKELLRLFEVLEGKLIIPGERNLMISPFSTRENFTKLIENEIENARSGKKAKFTGKMNSLEDKEIISLLYKASNAGVKIKLLIRGFTCLIPGVKEMSENIFITSIVDRFLEHGRIYLFENGGDEKIYFGSADLMTRNLDRRIEVLAPILDKEIAKEFKDILQIQLNDNVKARIQDAAESNRYVPRAKNQKAIRSQYEIYHYLKRKHEL